MYRETQSELFIRTLTDFLNDLRVHQMARLRDRQTASFVAVANSTEQPARLTPWRG